MTAGILDRAAAEAAAPGDVLVRLALPPVTMTQLVFYCGAAGVTDPIHFDRAFAQRFGFPDCVVNGSLRVSWMAEAAASAVRAPNHLVEISCSHLKPMYVAAAGAIEMRLRERRTGSGGAVLLACDLEIRVGDDVVDRADAVLNFA